MTGPCRRRFAAAAAAFGAALLLPRGAAAQAAAAPRAGAARELPSTAARGAPAAPVDVWKSPSCGCCHGWIEHLRAAGFAVVAHDTGNTAKRAALGIPARLGSCHTARVGGYALEGHVPAREVRRLLAERPRAVGLAVPGMPIGSPGMEDGGRREPYEVLLVRADGTTEVFARYA
jgi:hypothetical protein